MYFADQSSQAKEDLQGPAAEAKAKPFLQPAPDNDTSCMTFDRGSERCVGTRYYCTNDIMKFPYTDEDGSVYKSAAECLVHPRNGLTTHGSIQNMWVQEESGRVFQACPNVSVIILTPWR
ncbi:hypothetical protein BDV32DRAFT_22870 [Aspergillus pseudonomiae]|uniref:Uncharacterized protein n=1 Tax=Aspergillus pseudonomiae TaxID=1506151 RepID=A0A5N7DKZ5_9EURO|nr:uncharacterized protein BDV37DRAFT_241955 [Aspergillus pseudonomiae]KAB8262267.1 hypothetical protein BDV32DRAFT_22870 [Aspergillus pseudonomiae]KAE8407122.1 hypothetical protein BDV37DRAFT_241955 [Aspergillus pseudonomiae]